MKPEPGTYILVLKSNQRASVQIGRWGHLEIQRGYYTYVGSAFGPGGVSARVSRHLREDKSKRWHIDYLREVTVPVSVWYSHDPDHLEHDWATVLSRMTGTVPINGLGCSDCRCDAHLFFSSKKPEFSEFTGIAQGDGVHSRLVA
jgi:Uri superfamily endonuclease